MRGTKIMFDDGPAAYSRPIAWRCLPARFSSSRSCRCALAPLLFPCSLLSSLPRPLALLAARSLAAWAFARQLPRRLQATRASHVLCRAVWVSRVQRDRPTDVQATSALYQQHHSSSFGNLLAALYWLRRPLSSLLPICARVSLVAIDPAARERLRFVAAVAVAASKSARRR